MATKEQIVDALKKAVGDTPYGQHIIADAEKNANPEKEGPYAQDMVDRLHEMIGVLAAYARIHKDAGEDAYATKEEDKVAIAKKALAAIEGLE